tara:strand:+ start:392 stop:859 length:468 start_codon:yes stop_codon:yes gene_type:complete
MKKLLVIIVLGILFSGNAYANLNGVKEFYLEVRHGGEKIDKCNKENFNSEIEINTKYFLGNSKIILSKTMNSEFLKLHVFTNKVEGTCASTIKLITYSVGYIKNFSGHKFVGEKISYNKEKLVISNKSSEHKNDVLSTIDLMLKKFVIDWNELNN